MNKVNDYYIEINGKNHNVSFEVFNIFHLTSIERDNLRLENNIKTPQMKKVQKPLKLNRKQCKQTAVFFASEMVYKALNPNSKMDTPSSVYVKIDKEFDKWNNNESKKH